MRAVSGSEEDAGDQEAGDDEEEIHSGRTETGCEAVDAFPERGIELSPEQMEVKDHYRENGDAPKPVNNGDSGWFRSGEHLNSMDT